MKAKQELKREGVRKPSWPPIRPHKVGEKSYWLIDAGKIAGRRQRFVRVTKGDAEVKAAELRLARTNEGRDALTMPKELRMDAGRAAALLRPYSASLTDAASHYVEHVLKFREAPSVKELVTRMIAEAAKSGRRARTVGDLDYRLGTFAKDFGTRQLSSITLAELQGWLDGGIWSARSRINFATKLSQLWGYALRHGWADRNVATLLNRPDAENGEPGILTPLLAGALLRASKTEGLLPFVALGLFAGLRTAELGRLQWDAVRVAEGNVIVGAEVAKKRSRRVVEINETLASWIGPWALRNGFVVPWRNKEEVSEIALRKRLEKARKGAAKALRKMGGEAVKHAAALENWQSNALRHSFGSYHLALHGDATKTAAQMGNDAIVVHGHYKALVTKTETDRFWALRPQEMPNMISIRAASA